MANIVNGESMNKWSKFVTNVASTTIISEVNGTACHFPLDSRKSIGAQFQTSIFAIFGLISCPLMIVAWLLLARCTCYQWEWILLKGWWKLCTASRFLCINVEFSLNSKDSVEFLFILSFSFLLFILLFLKPHLLFWTIIFSFFFSLSSSPVLVLVESS